MTFIELEDGTKIQLRPLTAAGDRTGAPAPDLARRKQTMADAFRAQGYKVKEQQA